MFHESKMCSKTMFTVNSLKCNFHLCQSKLSNLQHSNSYDFWICKG